MPAARVLVTDVLLQFGPTPLAVDSTRTGRAPRIDSVVRLVQLEVVDDVPQPQHAPWLEHLPEPTEGDGLPEFREAAS